MSHPPVLGFRHRNKSQHNTTTNVGTKIQLDILSAVSSSNKMAGIGRFMHLRNICLISWFVVSQVIPGLLGKALYFILVKVFEVKLLQN